MNNKKFVIVGFILITTGLLYVGYIKVLAKESQLDQARKSKSKTFISGQHKKRKIFNKDKNDVLSFLHIQKTGGTTMEKHLVLNIKNSNCKCKDSKRPSCMCHRKDMSEIWLICRYIQPKWPCGLHPDYDTLRKCSPRFMNKEYEERNRRFFYATILRNPVHRFLSEFRHIQRGATWENAASRCRDKMLSYYNEKCFEFTDTRMMSINDFINCSYNLAFNRQTWMLSSLSKVTCDFKKLFSTPHLKAKLLKIAKANLKKIFYFGLIEYPKESQFVFEKTFDMEFKEPFQKWDTGFAIEYANTIDLNTSVIEKLKNANDLDIMLYDFAKNLLLKRYKQFVDIYGEPNYGEPSTTSRFRLKVSKRDRLKENRPKSKSKEILLRQKRKKLLKKIKEKKLVLIDRENS